MGETCWGGGWGGGGGVQGASVYVFCSLNSSETDNYTDVNVNRGINKKRKEKNTVHYRRKSIPERNQARLRSKHIKNAVKAPLNSLVELCGR